MNLSCEVIINKPIQEVWDYTNNPDHLPLWLNDFVSYEHLTGDINAPTVGDTSLHTYRQNGNEFTMKEKITEYAPPHHVKLFMTSKWFDMEILNNFTQVGPSQTKLLATADSVRTGFIMKVIMIFMSRKKMHADHEQQIYRLKNLIESS